jgi:hypothetical protein
LYIAKVILFIETNKYRPIKYQEHHISDKTSTFKKLLKRYKNSKKHSYLLPFYLFILHLHTLGTMFDTKIKDIS